MSRELDLFDADAPVDPNDPGVDLARERAERVPLVPPSPIELRNGVVRIGTAGWTDPTLLPPGVFYPQGVDSPEARLRFYASRFPSVEVDSPYYAIPVPAAAGHWVDRTPDDFIFDVKAYALMTGQASEVNRLPRAIRDELPADLATKTRVYPKDLPEDLVDEVWMLFREGISPLERAGKLGAVLMQYPRWFVPGRPALAEIEKAQERLDGLTMVVELRNGRWFSERSASRTLTWFTERKIPLVIVDGPQGMESSVPAVLQPTSPDLAIVRLHGRRTETWEKPGAPVVEKYRYLYDEQQLDEWARKITELAGAVSQTRVVFNNCYGNYGTTNALEMGALLRSG